MPRILLFTSKPDDWRAWLADPGGQWRRGYSARTLAYSWEASDGFPLEIATVLGQATDPLLANMSPILAVPEFKVPLPGGGRASQNDIFVLGRSYAGPVCIMVEVKVEESFGPTLGEWRPASSPGKSKRLGFLLHTLGITTVPGGDIRYQLLHRAALAILTGEQFHARASILLVHSFSGRKTGWRDYERFVRLFGRQAIADTVQRLSTACSIPLFAAWVTGDRSFLES
jgi:Domain of unknown function (DUF6946)